MMGTDLEQPKGRFALVNGRVILPHKIVSGRAVVVEGTQILDIADPTSLGSEVQQIDVGGRYIGPGLLDIHTHGALGYTFNEPTAEAFAAITEENVTRGVTGLLANPHSGRWIGRCSAGTPRRDQHNDLRTGVARCPGAHGQAGQAGHRAGRRAQFRQG
jgi:N-acetylglucosamine-6-phosphate deacetylase